jgi:hypothetical protein
MSPPIWRAAFKILVPGSTSVEIPSIVTLILSANFKIFKLFDYFYLFGRSSGLSVYTAQGISHKAGIHFYP